MITVTKVQTFDGRLHESTKAASQHLDKLFGDLITGLAHRIVKAEKYAAIVDLLENEVGTMRKIIQVNDDLLLPVDSVEEP